MTKPLHVTRSQARRLERNLQGKPKRMVGREIMPGFVVHVAPDVDPKTMQALQELGRLLMAMTPEELTALAKKAKRKVRK